MLQSFSGAKSSGGVRFPSPALLRVVLGVTGNCLVFSGISELFLDVFPRLLHFSQCSVLASFSFLMISGVSKAFLVLPSRFSNPFEVILHYFRNSSLFAKYLAQLRLDCQTYSSASAIILQANFSVPRQPSVALGSARQLILDSSKNPAYSMLLETLLYLLNAQISSTTALRTAFSRSFGTDRVARSSEASVCPFLESSLAGPLSGRSP